MDIITNSCLTKEIERTKTMSDKKKDQINTLSNHPQEPQGPYHYHEEEVSEANEYK